MSSARQALGVVGAVVGNFILPGVGGAIGGVIGGELGGFIDGPPEGPKLEDTSAPAVQYGAKVPRVYGRVWCELSPLWWSGLRESSEVVGGKGGDSGVEQFIYHCDMLGRLADGSNVVAVSRIEIDGEVVYSALADSPADTIANSQDTPRWGSFTLQTGDAAQTPWSVYEAAVGAANASAYRGQCTIGFENLWMKNGRQPSRIRVEVVTEATEAPPALTVEVLATWIETPLVPGSEHQFFAIQPSATEPEYKFLWNGGGRAVCRPDAESPVDPMPANCHFAIVLTETERRIYFDGELSVELPYTDFELDADGMTITIGDPNGYHTGTTNFIVHGFRVSRSELYTGASFTPPTSFGAPASTVLSQSNFLAGNAADQVSGDMPTQDGGLVTPGAFVVFRDNAADPGAASTLTYQAGSGMQTITPGLVDLQDILEAEILRCSPLTSADIDMSAAAGKMVEGYKAIGSAAQAIQPLLTWFYLDLYSDDKLRLVPRGGAVEQTIENRWTGNVSEAFAGLVRNNDVEIQRATAVQYINILQDGETDTRTGERESIGSETRTLTLPLYSRPSEAQGRADTATWDARVAGHRATIRIGARHGLKILPGSVIAVLDHKGNSYRVLVIRCVWDRWAWECDVRLDDPTILQTVGIAVDIDSQVITVAAAGDAEFLALDAPPLRSADTAPTYLAVTKTSDNSACRWYHSEDGGTTPQAGPQFLNDAVFGTVTAIDGTLRADGFIQEDATITVNVGAGTMASITRAAMLANRASNAFLVGVNGRLVLGQVRSAALVGSGVYALTGFLFGLNGTGQYVDDIAVGDNFVMLGTQGTDFIDRTLAEIGILIDVKAVCSGASLSSEDWVDFTPTGESLKPRSPVQLRLERDSSTGDITGTFNRRTRADTRFGGDFGDACPLGEESERYRVRIYSDGTYSTLMRDLGVVTSPTFDYSGSDQTTDFGSHQTTVHVGIRQLSATVGEGHELQAAA